MFDRFQNVYYDNKKPFRNYAQFETFKLYGFECCSVARCLIEISEMKPKTAVKIDENGSNKKVYFGDNGQVVDEPVEKPKPFKKPETAEVEEEATETGDFVKPKKGFKKYQQNGDDLQAKWYQAHEEYNTNEFKDIKDSELSTLQQLCRSSFNDEIQKMSKSKSNR